VVDPAVEVTVGGAATDAMLIYRAPPWSPSACPAATAATTMKTVASRSSPAASGSGACSAVSAPSGQVWVVRGSLLTILDRSTWGNGGRPASRVRSEGWAYRHR